MDVNTKVFLTKTRRSPPQEIFKAICTMRGDPERRLTFDAGIGPWDYETHVKIREGYVTMHFAAGKSQNLSQK